MGAEKPNALTFAERTEVEITPTRVDRKNDVFIAPGSNIRDFGAIKDAVADRSGQKGDKSQENE